MTWSPGRSRPVRRLATVSTLVMSLALVAPAQAGPSVTGGDIGSGPPAPAQAPALAAHGPVPTPTPRQPSTGFTDIGDSSLAFATTAIKYVAVTNQWMTDYGTDTFRPTILETRALFARAIVEAFAPTEPTDPTITFTDLASTDPKWPFANVAVKLGWMQRNKDGAFRPDDPITMTGVHYALVSALPLADEVAGLNAIHTADGYTFAHPDKFAQILLGMLLHFRYNHPSEGDDVTPKDPLSRAEVAYSLWRAATVTKYDIEALSPYKSITLPAIPTSKRQFIEFGIKYVGYPYIWGGDWYQKTPPGYCCGAQPQGGFDCSGFAWWDLKAPADGYDNTAIRGYTGWSLPQRVAADMASVGKHLSYSKARPGDLMFYDGDNNGSIDHVDVYLGNGWALDSSSGQGGVTILRVGEGWYHDHFVHARRIMNG